MNFSELKLFLWIKTALEFYQAGILGFFNMCTADKQLKNNADLLDDVDWGNESFKYNIGRS